MAEVRGHGGVGIASSRRTKGMDRLCGSGLLTSGVLAAVIAPVSASTFFRLTDLDFAGASGSMMSEKVAAHGHVEMKM